MTYSDAADWINASLPIVAVPQEDMWRLVAGAAGNARVLVWADVFWTDSLGRHPFHVAEGDVRTMSRNLVVGKTTFMPLADAPAPNPREWTNWLARAEETNATLERLTDVIRMAELY